MSRIVTLAVDLHRAEVLPFLEYPPGREPAPATERLLSEVLAAARGVLGPRGAWRVLPGAEGPAVGLPAREDRLVLGIATVGPGPEDRAVACAARGEATRALLWEAAGSAAVEEAADRLAAAAVQALGGDGGERCSCRQSPGYGAWPLEAQVPLLARLPCDALGIHLRPSLLMVPRKTVSFAFWLDAGGVPRAPARGCARCTHPTCRQRRAPEEDP